MRNLTKLKHTHSLVFNHLDESTNDENFYSFPWFKIVSLNLNEGPLGLDSLPHTGIEVVGTATGEHAFFWIRFEEVTFDHNRHDSNVVRDHLRIFAGKLIRWANNNRYATSKIGPVKLYVEPQMRGVVDNSFGMPLASGAEEPKDTLDIQDKDLDAAAEQLWNVFYQRFVYKADMVCHDNDFLRAERKGSAKQLVYRARFKLPFDLTFVMIEASSTSLASNLPTGFRFNMPGAYGQEWVDGSTGTLQFAGQPQRFLFGHPVLGPLLNKAVLNVDLRAVLNTFVQEAFPFLVEQFQDIQFDELTEGDTIETTEEAESPEVSGEFHEDPPAESDAVPPDGAPKE